MKNKKLLLIAIPVVLIIAIITIIIVINTNATNKFEFSIEITGKYKEKITEKDIKHLNVEKKTFTMNTSANKKFTDEYKIIKMTDFLKVKNITKYDNITLYAKDDFSAKLNKEDIEKSYFGIPTDKDEKENGLMSIVPHKGSKFWVKNIAKIEVK